jgi:dTDP-4-amino-4,6-dideoxygalactose transaminase
MNNEKINNEKIAIEGGTSVHTQPYAPWPYFELDEIETVTSVLKSGRVNYWTGEEGRLFEKEFADFTGCKYAVALANGTVALELALYALGIGSGDEIIVPSRTFIASASCVVMRGAKPVIADVDSVSQNITAKTISAALTSQTKAIIAVHLAGWPCDMDPILKLAKEHNIKVIEDCAQAHGATYKGKMVGSLGDVAAFSFCQDKIMTTGGEGGMLTTNDRNIWERAWSFKDHGKNYHAIYNCRQQNGYKWVHESFGTNWRLTEIQSAIGRIQLQKLPKWIAKRRENASILTKRFSCIPGLRITIPPEEIGHSYYKYYTFVIPEQLRNGWNRDRILSLINKEGIPCFGGSCSEIYLEKAFDIEGMRPIERLKIAKKLGQTSLMFLVHPTLSEKNMEDTCRAVEKVMRMAAR